MTESNAGQPPTDSENAAGNRSLPRRLLPWGLRSLGLLVIVALGFLGVDLIGGLELMLDARPEFLVPAFAVFCVALGGRMLVWISLARHLRLGYERSRSYVRLWLIGWSAALGLPRGASPLARAAVIAADKRSVGRSVIVDIADRLLQVGTFIVLLLVSSAYLSAGSTRMLLGLGIALGTIAGLGLLVRLAWPTLRAPLRRINLPRWAESFLNDMATALRELRRTRPSRLFGLFAASMVASILAITSLFLVTRSLDVNLSYPAVAAAFSAVSLTVLFPISINGLGPREGILTAAVAGAGFSSEAGVALGLLWFVMQAVTRLAALPSWFMSSGEETADPSGPEKVEAGVVERGQSA